MTENKLQKDQADPQTNLLNTRTKSTYLEIRQQNLDAQQHSIFEKIMSECLPNLMKNINP